MATSEKQVATNRKNAQKSTGPKTETGKAMVARNAVKHGILSVSPALPVVESEQDWICHYEAIRDNLNPVGYLENILAERLALLSWRLGRVVRFERETLAFAQENVENEVAENRRFGVGVGPQCRAIHPDDVRWQLEHSEELAKLLGSLVDDTNDTHFSSDEVSSILEALAEKADTDLSELTFPGFPPLQSLEAETWEGCSTNEVLAALEIIAKTVGEDPSRVLKDTLVQANLDKIQAEQEIKKITHDIRNFCNPHYLLENDLLEKVSRYESHLERSFFRTLDELHKMQARRKVTALLPIF